MPMEAKQKLSGKNRKGKLSLKRKNTSRKEDSDGSNTGNQKDEVLKAISGEFSLNQSEDFRDASKTVRLQLKKSNPKLLKKSLPSLSRSKSNVKLNPGKNDSTLGTASSGSESKNDKDKVRNSENDNKSKQVNEEKQSTNNVDTEETTADSSITSCKVLLSKIPMTCEAPETATRSTCPVCLKHIRSTNGSQGMQDHINLCLKKHFSAIGDTSEDAYLAQQLHEREQEKATEENLTESEFYPCQLCHKDLSKMNSTRRLQHMNRCIDVIEKDVQEQEKVKKNAAKRMIPDCPMCGVQLNTKLQRDSHLKRCARELGVPSAQLIDIVKRQEQELASRVDTQPQSEVQVQSTSNTTIAQPNLPRPRGRPKKKRKKPGEGLDDETQLAMAMSASLAPQQSTSEVPDVSDSNGPVKQKRGRKKKNADAEIPVLLVRSEAERQRMLEDRLSKLVAPQEVRNLDKTPSLRRSRVAEKCGKQSRSPKSGGKGTFQRQSSLLWGLSAQDDPKLVSRTPFYVSQLKPVIAPGHIKTPSKETPAKRVKLKDNDEVNGTQTISSTLQVLMDLEEEGTHASSPSIEGSGDSRQEASGFLGNPKATLQVSKPADEHEEVVLQQLASLINCEKLSDIKIKTADGSIVHAHSLLLHLRCPKLLQHLNESASNRSCSLDIPKDVLLAILKYVYCGSIDVDGTIALDVLRYAQNYDLTDLARSCQSILKTRTTPHKSSNKGGKEGSDVDLGNSKMQTGGDDEVYQEKDLDELIQSLWDDSEDDHDESKNSCKDSDSENEASDSCPNEADMQEIYEYASTQAKQTKQAGSHRSEAINQKTATDNSTGIERSILDVNITKSADSTADDVSEETDALCVVDKQPKNSNRSPSHQSQESPKNVVSTKSAESTADNVSDETNVLSVVDIQPTNSTRSPSDQGQESIQADTQKIPSATGRLTRRGWKPFPAKEMSKKLKNKVNVNDSSGDGATQPTNTITFRITDDHNEQDVEMEDLSQDAEKDPGRDGNKDNEPIKATSGNDASTSVSKNSERQPTKDTERVQPTKDKERVLDLTENLSPPSPVTRSSPKKKQSFQKKQTSHKTRQPSETVASRSRIASESGVVDEFMEGNSGNQLDESTDESDTSWIIPNTPPAKPSNAVRKTFVLPNNRASQARFSQGFSLKQNTSALTASTPIDMRNRMGSFVGSNFLPQMSPVKVVLEKLSLSTSGPAVTGAIHIKSKGVDTSTEATDHGSGIEQSSFNDKNINHAITPSKHTELDNKESNTPLENKAQTRQTRKKSVLERSSERSSPGRRSTRSLSPTPVKQIQRKKLTIKGSLQKSLKGSPNGGFSKASPRKDESPSQKDIVVSTPTRRSRRISVASSGKRTPDSSRGRASPIVVPEAIEVSTPVVLSDESPSPTPSPKFGGTSSKSVPISHSKDDIRDNPPQDEFLSFEQQVDKPSKRKRKQSMPMRSPDKLHLTVNDAPVDVTQTNKLKLNARKLKTRTTVPYSSPKIKKSPPNFPLKKKYKSFTPLRSHSKMRRRTRSMSKGTPLMGNKNRNGNNTQNVEKACHDNNGCTSGRKATPIKDKESESSSQVEDHKMKGSKTDQENGPIYQKVASDVTRSEEQPSDDDTNEDQVVLVGSTPSVTDENVTDNGNDQMEEEICFAFDVDDGGFDGFNNFPGSNHDDDDHLSRGEQQNISNINVPQVRSPNEVSVPTSRHHHNSEILIPRVSSPPENLSPIPIGLQNVLKIDTPRIRPSPPETNQQNGSQIDISRIRSPPEVRIPQISEKEKFGKELWANLYVTPARSTGNVVSPVITEKVITLENYTALSRQPRIEENGDTICFANAELVPSHRHATASPTLREHIFSPSQSVTSPVECGNGEVGYFGVGSDSFMMEMQEEVIETGVGANEGVVANGNEVETPFVPPPCAMQNVNHNVAIVRPTPIRPNTDDQYHPPGPITPMPNYEDMDTPALRKETFKYGLKPLRKKQARLKLKEIYEYTHQVLETSLDDDSNSNQNKHAASKATASKSKRVAKPKAKQSKKAKGQGPHSLAPGSGDKTGSDGAPKDNGAKDSTPTKQKEGGQGESSGETSDALSYNDCPEDSILDDGDDDEIPMSQPLSKNPEEAIMAYIKGNTVLYQKILMYEPLFIKEFQKELKEAGIYCSIDQLKVILDKQCITFRAEAGVNRHVRKAKKKKTK